MIVVTSLLARYAGNVLVFPHGDWLGYMQPDDAVPLLDALMTQRAPFSSLSVRVPLLADRWRGRMGMAPVQQQEILTEFRRSAEAR